MIFEHDDTATDCGVKIKIIGVGGGGGNAVNRMVAANVQGVDIYALNTDKLAFRKSEVANKIIIGEKITKGFGAGANRQIGARAAEESIAYQSYDLVHAMELDVGQPITALKVDGGASRDQFLMQFQADILNKTVLRPAIRETTALGAAYLAGLATGVWKDRGEIRSLWHCNMTFTPNMEAPEREKLLAGWHKAVGRSRDWAEHE